MSKAMFLEQPSKATGTIYSIGPRGSGKTFLMMQCIKYWLENNVFDHYYLVIPDFEDEQNDSYSWLKDHANVTVYEGYHSKLGKEILDRSELNKKDNTSKGTKLEKYMLAIDDATGMGKTLMKCEHLVKISTSARHKRVHFWACLHATAGILPPKIRYMTSYIFIYDVHKEHLKTMYKEFINFPEDFKNFNEFNAFFSQYVRSKKHGCLLVNHQNDPKSYNPYACDWFS